MRKVLWEAASLPTAELHAASLHTSSCLPSCGIHLQVSMLHLHVSMLHLHVSMLQAWPTIHTATLCIYMDTRPDAERGFFFFGDLEAAELLDTQAHHTH